MNNIILYTDGYKLAHHVQYPKGTTLVYSNLTPRSNKYFPNADGATVFGIQYFIKKYLIDEFNKNFFNKPEEEVVAKFKRRIDTFLGTDNNVGIEHIRALHKLGYLPLKIKALPEGTLCPIRVPYLTIVNTHPDFFWLTNYLETLISCELWLPVTSATHSRLALKALKEHCERVGIELNPFLVHDFSMRGMAGLEAAVVSGMAHLTSFVGSETIPAIEALEDYYDCDVEKELIAGTVPATEHSVMCAGGDINEFETYKRLINEIYPTGYVSIVSDTWDYWNVITNYLPRLKNNIMARNGRVVIRPDSGDPVDIVCGLYTNPHYNAIHKDGKYYISDVGDSLDMLVEVSRAEFYGSYFLLWEIFGGTINEKGFKILDSHIGMIYGDSINLERQRAIYERLEAKGFTASNLVLGYGSYTFQYNTRDQLGQAVKATYCEINGEPHEIYKNPKTDDGTKKSLKGLICVKKDESGKYYAIDQVSKEIEDTGCLKTVFLNGELVNPTNLKEIRANVQASL